MKSFFSEKPTLESLAKLQTEEKKILSLIYKALQNKNPTDLKNLAAISKYGLDTLFKFSSQSEAETKEHVLTKESIEFIKFCEKDSFLNEVWEDLLEKQKYPQFLIVDINQNPLFTPFKQLLSIFLFEQFKKYWYVSEKNDSLIPQQGLNLLDKACEYGNFYAITFRHKLKLEKFMNQTLSENEINLLIGECLTLGTQFWSEGYVQAAGLLTALASQYLKEGKTNFAELLFQASLEALCSAEILSTEKESQKLQKIFSSDGKIILDEVNQFTTYTAACNHILKISGLKTSDYNLAQKNARTRIKLPLDRTEGKMDFRN